MSAADYYGPRVLVSLAGEQPSGWTPKAINEPSAAAELLVSWWRESGIDPTREHFLALYLDAQQRPRAAPHIVSIGSLQASLVHPREVYGPALALGMVAGVIVAHNHPSGELNPSNDDRAVTRRLADAGQLLGVPLLDHLIIAPHAHRRFYSFEASGTLTRTTNKT